MILTTRPIDRHTHVPRARRVRSRTGGFTFIELLVAAAALLILLAIFIPYLEKFRESARRTVCAEHLGILGDALRKYAQDNAYDYPRVRFDAASPNTYAAFTGPWSSDAFAPTTAVAPNDVTASLWLLLKSGYVNDPGLFICPGSDNWADPMTDAHGRASKLSQRANFQSASNLSYSYATPFGDAWNYRLNSDHLPADFALMSDKNPGFATDRASGVIGPAHDAPPLDMALANSFNHQHAGQNVLFAAGYVKFEPNPYCGIGGDNIFTALTPVRMNGEHPPLDATGFIGPTIGPAYEFDSYLVPTARE